MNVTGQTQNMSTPLCKRCLAPCQNYGPVGGYSALCASCNDRNAARQRAARAGYFLNDGKVDHLVAESLHCHGSYKLPGTKRTYRPCPNKPSWLIGSAHVSYCEQCADKYPKYAGKVEVLRRRIIERDD